MSGEFGNKVISELGTLEYRVFFSMFLTTRSFRSPSLANKEGKLISPIQDIPLWVNKAGGVARMVIEIPRGTHPKLEMHTGGPMNPIKQDVKNGKLRAIHDAYPFNYGAFPQTWEDPNHVDKDTQCKGDFDPVDVCEVGSKTFKTGDVVHVKILGVWAMIDDGETDWKILSVSVDDENAAKWNDFSDVPKEVVEPVFTFLRDYKIPAGSGPNKFAFDGELKNKEFALHVVNETHDIWAEAVTGKRPVTSGKGTFEVYVFFFSLSNVRSFRSFP